MVPTVWRERLGTRRPLSRARSASASAATALRVGTGTGPRRALAERAAIQQAKCNTVNLLEIPPSPQARAAASSALPLDTPKHEGSVRSASLTPQSRGRACTVEDLDSEPDLTIVDLDFDLDLPITEQRSLIIEYPPDHILGLDRHLLVFRVCSHLDPRELCSLVAASREFRSVASSNFLWRQLVQRRFGKSVRSYAACVRHQSGSWKAVYSTFTDAVEKMFGPCSDTVKPLAPVSPSAARRACPEGSLRAGFETPQMTTMNGIALEWHRLLSSMVRTATSANHAPQAAPSMVVRNGDGV